MIGVIRCYSGQLKSTYEVLINIYAHARLTKDVGHQILNCLIHFWVFGYDVLTRPVAVNILNYQSFVQPDNVSLYQPTFPCLSIVEYQGIGSHTNSIAIYVMQSLGVRVKISKPEMPDVNCRECAPELWSREFGQWM